MKKFINSEDTFLKESLQGFGPAHQDIVTCFYNQILLPDPRLQK